MRKPRIARISIFSPPVLRRFFPALFFAALICGLLVAAIYQQDVAHQRGMLQSESEHVLALQQVLLDLEVRSVESDLLYLASQAQLARYLSGDDSVRKNLEEEYISFARNKGIYDQIRCLDIDGQELVRVNYGSGTALAVPQHELQSKAMRYYYRQALLLERDEVFVSPFDLNIEHGQIEQPIKPVIRFLTPVFDGSGTKQGLLVLNYLGAPLLSKLRQVSARFGGTTMLLNPSGEYLSAPDTHREWGWLLDHPNSFRTDYPEAWQARQEAKGKHIRLGRSLFSFQQVTLGRRLPWHTPPHSSGDPEPSSSSLILVAHVSSSAASGNSRDLLNQLSLMSLGAMAIVAPLCLYWARSTAIRKYHEQRIMDSEARLRQLSSLLLATQEAERRRLSRYLHDELGQQVTAISLDLRSLQKKHAEFSQHPVLCRTIDECDQLLRCVHETATRVRPSVLDDLGLQDAVESYLEEYRQRTGIHVIADLSLDAASIPASVGENCYRIVQEALANVATHARVDVARLSIETDPEMLYMKIRDEGIGFEPLDALESARLGILGMRERVELLKGHFVLESKPGAGTEIRISIPLRAQRALNGNRAKSATDNVSA